MDDSTSRQGGNWPQTWALPQIWHETLFDVHKASVYRCKRNVLWPSKYAKNAFPAGSPLGELTTFHRPSSLGIGRPYHTPTHWALSALVRSLPVQILWSNLTKNLDVLNNFKWQPRNGNIAFLRDSSREVTYALSVSLVRPFMSQYTDTDDIDITTAAAIHSLRWGYLFYYICVHCVIELKKHSHCVRFYTNS